MSDLRKLLPCPFCGKQGSLEDPDTLYPTAHWREDEEIRHYFGLRDGRQHHGEVWTMHCPQPAGGCGAQISGDSEDEAVDNWNRRIDAALAEPKDSQPVPVEPDCVKAMRHFAAKGEPDAKEGVEYIDTLQSALRQRTEEQEIGRRWKANSSLEEWFPYTAEELKRVTEERDELREVADNATKMRDMGLAITTKNKEFAEQEHEHRRAAESLNKRMVELLRRYRNETPLGNQPAMIAHEVDELLKEVK